MTWLNWPNRISIARILMIAPLVICLLKLNEDGPGWRRLALAFFILMALSDALDGFLARRLDEETPLGRFLDPLGDKLLVFFAVILLSLESTAVPGFRLPSWVAVVAVGKDVVTVAGFSLVYLTTGKHFIRPRIWGKACTLVQFVLVAYCLVGPDLPAALARIHPVLYWAATILAVLAVVDYLWFGNREAAAEHQQANTPSE